MNLGLNCIAFGKGLIVNVSNELDTRLLTKPDASIRSSVNQRLKSVLGRTNMTTARAVGSRGDRGSESTGSVDDGREEHFLIDCLSD